MSVQVVRYQIQNLYNGVNSTANPNGFLHVLSFDNYVSSMQVDDLLVIHMIDAGTYSTRPYTLQRQTWTGNPISFEAMGFTPPASFSPPPTTTANFTTTDFRMPTGDRDFSNLFYKWVTTEDIINPLRMHVRPSLVLPGIPNCQTRIQFGLYILRNVNRSNPIKAVTRKVANLSSLSSTQPTSYYDSIGAITGSSDGDIVFSTIIDEFGIPDNFNLDELSDIPQSILSQAVPDQRPLVDINVPTNYNLPSLNMWSGYRRSSQAFIDWAGSNNVLSSGTTKQHSFGMSFVTFAYEDYIPESASPSPSTSVSLSPSPSLSLSPSPDATCPSSAPLNVQVIEASFHSSGDDVTGNEKISSIVLSDEPCPDDLVLVFTVGSLGTVFSTFVNPLPNNGDDLYINTNGHVWRYLDSSKATLSHVNNATGVNGSNFAWSINPRSRLDAVYAWGDQISTDTLPITGQLDSCVVMVLRGVKRNYDDTPMLKERIYWSESDPQIRPFLSQPSSSYGDDSLAGKIFGVEIPSLNPEDFASGVPVNTKHSNPNALAIDICVGPFHGSLTYWRTQPYSGSAAPGATLHIQDDNTAYPDPPNRNSFPRMAKYNVASRVLVGDENINGYTPTIPIENNFFTFANLNANQTGSGSSDTLFTLIFEHSEAITTSESPSPSASISLSPSLSISPFFREVGPPNCAEAFVDYGFQDRFNFGILRIIDFRFHHGGFTVKFSDGSKITAPFVAGSGQLSLYDIDPMRRYTIQNFIRQMSIEAQSDPRFGGQDCEFVKEDADVLSRSLMLAVYDEADPYYTSTSIPTRLSGRMNYETDKNEWNRLIDLIKRAYGLNMRLHIHQPRLSGAPSDTFGYRMLIPFDDLGGQDVEDDYTAQWPKDTDRTEISRDFTVGLSVPGRITRDHLFNAYLAATDNDTYKPSLMTLLLDNSGSIDVDVHYGGPGSPELVEFRNMVRAINPDIIFVTDQITDSRENWVRAAIDSYSRLLATSGF